MILHKNAAGPDPAWPVRVRWFVSYHIWPILLPAMIASAAFSALLLARHVNPVVVVTQMIKSSLLDPYGLTETAVKTIPIILTAYCVALCQRGGLVTLGGEGQMSVGAIGASIVAIYLPVLTGWQTVSLMILIGSLFGGVWAGIAGFLKSRFKVNETIVTLLLNYVAILILKYLVFGPMRSPDSLNFPQSLAFPPHALFPTIRATRIHLGAVLAIASGLLLYLFFNKTRAGFLVKVVGKNLQVAHYMRIPVRRTWFLLLFFSGVLAALAGVGEVAAIQTRLRPDISNGLGYAGFLVSWLSRHNLGAIPVCSFLVAALISAGDSLQILAGLPYATVEILQGLVFLATLASLYLLGTRECRRGQAAQVG